MQFHNRGSLNSDRQRQRRAVAKPLIHPSLSHQKQHFTIFVLFPPYISPSLKTVFQPIAAAEFASPEQQKIQIGLPLEKSRYAGRAHLEVCGFR
ncbi:MAG: hypothetical protein MOB07_10775 [Acidobacteria bacterium]|nr:hypothetical protein [Acidobacteriota bacterium]